MQLASMASAVRSLIVEDDVGRLSASGRFDRELHALAQPGPGLVLCHKGIVGARGQVLRIGDELEEAARLNRERVLEHGIVIGVGVVVDQDNRLTANPQLVEQRARVHPEGGILDDLTGSHSAHGVGNVEVLCRPPGVADIRAAAVRWVPRLQNKSVFANWKTDVAPRDSDDAAAKVEAIVVRASQSNQRPPRLVPFRDGPPVAEPFGRDRRIVKRLVQMLDSFEIGGSAKIAQMLARAGLKIGRETVRRYRKAPRPPRPAENPQAKTRVLRAKYVNHIWTADLTEIRSFLGLFRFKIVVVLDLFSRFPLAFGIFQKEPTADQVLDVLDRAMRRHGHPRHFVSDQGSQFTAAVFRETLDSLSIGQRFGAIGQYGSIAIIERFWRTLKELFGIRSWPPLSAAHLEARTERALGYYSSLRPHQGLGGATPAEVYLDETPAASSAIPPPRKTARSTTGGEPLPFEVVFLDPERCLPVLVPTSKVA